MYYCYMIYNIYETQFILCKILCQFAAVPASYKPPDFVIQALQVEYVICIYMNVNIDVYVLFYILCYYSIRMWSVRGMLMTNLTEHKN